jgi:hypothetical protein
MTVSATSADAVGRSGVGSRPGGMEPNLDIAMAQVSPELAITIMSALMSETEVAAGANQIEKAQHDRAVNTRKEIEALREAEQAEKEADGWLEIVQTAGTVVAVAASVAAVVGTAGAAAPVVVLAVAGATASLSSTAMKEGLIPDRSLGEIGGVEIQLSDALGVAGMAAGGGAGLLASGAKEVSTAARVAGAACRAVQAGGTAVQAYGTVQVGSHRADALGSHADAKELGARTRINDAIGEQGIEKIETALEARRRAFEALERVLAEKEAVQRAILGRRA